MTAPGIEGLTVSEWINDRLMASSALAALSAPLAGDLAHRLWEAVAPAETPGPWWVVWTILPPRDVKVVGLIQVMAEVQFQVKVTTQGTSYVEAMPVYRAVHAALENQNNQATSFTGGRVLSCGRVSGIQYPETASGVEYRHLGGLYETHAQ